ncbi:MAG: SufD family Fe-S cluster assembly protein [Corynebacterium provencense]|jgi:Fe-S cluster assembly scaffold protein SufB|uniref:SufD family Fe-S cluster assembly protein n=1 Tax=Corynebacterium provencense TaxID=1737425 RepID=UPI002989BBC9|nr:SufD family Fe-S cluster assembly protein [Corynebacterium provencense]
MTAPAATPTTADTGTTAAEFSATVGPDAAGPELLAQVGWEDPARRSSTTVVLDHGYSTMDSSDPDVIVLPLAEALTTYPWVQDLMWSLISPDDDDTLRRAFESTRTPLGTFTWVRDNARVELPRQSFTVMTVPQERQFVHDITVIGRNAEVDSVSGSAVAPGLTRGTHVSVGETFIGEGARLRSVDVDRWGPEMTVYTYDRTRVGEGAVLSSVSVAVSALKKARSSSVTELGKDARCTSHSIVFAPEGTDRGMEDLTVMTGPGAQAEMVARMVSDGGRIRNASTLTSTAPDVRGFLECDGLLLRDGGGINSVPSLDARVARAQLSHEASVGMIDDEKLDYLKALGMDEDAARDLIVQGFLNLEDDRIPASVRDRVTELVSAARGAEKL